MHPSFLRSRPRTARLAVGRNAIAGAAFAKPPLSSAPAPSTGPFPVAGVLNGVALQQIASGLGTVTGITHAGDSRLFLTVRDGRILIRTGGGNLLPQPFLDIRDKTTTDGERGLLSTAFHPHYAETGFFFVDYTNLQGNTVIARYHVAAGDPNRADPASAKILLTIEQPFSNHNGGQLQFGPDGYLYIGIGDGGDADDPACRAQAPTTCSARCCASTSTRTSRRRPTTGFPPRTPSAAPAIPSTRSGRAACATPGASPSTARRGTCGSPTSARGGARRSTSSPPAITAARTTAGRSWRGRSAT